MLLLKNKKKNGGAATENKDEENQLPKSATRITASAERRKLLLNQETCDRSRRYRKQDALVLVDTNAPVWSLNDFDIGKKLVRLALL